MSNLRQMLFPVYDNDGNIIYDQKPNGELTPRMTMRSFKQVVYREIITLATGDRSHQIFNNSNATASVNYTRQGKNFLESGEGQVLAHIIIPLSASGPFTPGAALATTAANDYNDMIHAGDVRYFKNNEPIDENVMVNLAPSMAIRWQDAAAAPANIALQDINFGAMTERESLKPGNWFKNPPLYIGDNNIFRAEFTYPVPVPVSLNGYRLAHYAVCNVFPKNSQQLPRS